MEIDSRAKKHLKLQGKCLKLTSKLWSKITLIQHISVPIESFHSCKIYHLLVACFSIFKNFFKHLKKNLNVENVQYKYKSTILYS